MVKTIFVAVDSLPGGDAWAASVLGELLGRPGLDVRLLQVVGEEDLAIGSSQRLMWDQSAGERLLVSRWTLGRWREWFSRQSMDTELMAAGPIESRPDRGGYSRVGHSQGNTVDVLGEQSDPALAAAAVLRWQKNGLGEDIVDDADLDLWIDQLDDELGREPNW